MPPAVETVTSTDPLPTGEVALRLVGPEYETEVASVVPKSTVVPAVKPVPVTVTTVPPASGPAPAVMPVTAGTGS